MTDTKWRSPTGYSVANRETDKLPPKTGDFLTRGQVTKTPENVSCENVSNFGGSFSNDVKYQGSITDGKKLNSIRAVLLNKNTTCILDKTQCFEGKCGCAPTPAPICKSCDNGMAYGVDGEYPCPKCQRNNAPTENVDLDVLKSDMVKMWSPSDTASKAIEAVIDHLANTGRLR